MADPEVSSNNTEYQKLVRAVSDIQVRVRPARLFVRCTARSTRKRAAHVHDMQQPSVVLHPTPFSQEAVDAYAAYKDVERQLADAKELLRESDGALRCSVQSCMLPAVATIMFRRRFGSAMNRLSMQPVPWYRHAARICPCHAVPCLSSVLLCS